MVEIREARRQDMRAVGRVLAAAFFDSPITEWILPAKLKRPIALRAFYGSGARDALRHGRVWVADDCGEIVGAAVWLPPGAYPPSASRDLRAVIPILALSPFAPISLVRSLRYQAAVTRAHTKDEHWYLVSIGVEPSRRGSGLGTALLAPGLAAASADGRPCYLETEKERNLPFYGRHRFEVTVHLEHPTGTAPQVWCMYRPAD